jgi:uncharacterized phiE125 gp8 family phage protein
MYKEIADNLTAPLISLADFKEFARVTASVPADEALMESLLLASIIYCEKYTGIAIGSKNYTRVFEFKQSDIKDLYTDNFELRKGFVTSVIEVARHDTDSKSIYDITNLDVENYKQNSVAYLPNGLFYYGNNPIKPFTVTFAAGYDNTNLPASLKTAIMQLATYWYENRESVQIMDENNVAEMPLGTTSILNLHRLVRM